jgi:heme-degrading monooxygenase HmoA
MTTDKAPGLPGPAVLINVFEMAARDVELFVAGWRQRADMMAGQPGFISAHLYRALYSGTRFQLVNVAHWASRDDLRQAVIDPAFQARIATAGLRRGAVRAHPAVYREIVVHE